ncbi:serine-rich adhesin for platelets isoform X4 [Bactrocera oleae]|uniref:serine-rich adhesin for platelets isoform X4 n=1 Tax=Bactrocera oleae TaxID=104688 RepID=UPI00387E8A92
MGKCVSKHPSVLTIALSEKDLAAANHIWSKFAESTEYIALKDEHGNQLCEYYYVSGKKRKAKPKTTKQTLVLTDRDNDAKTTTVGATQPAGQTEHSNENQNQSQQQQSQKKGKNKRRSKTAQKQSSTQQSSENKSQQWTTNREQTTNTNGTESYTEKLQQDCVTSQTESAHTPDGLTTTAATATTSTIVYPSVSGCEYCTVVSTTDDESEGEHEDEDEHDDSDDGEQLFGIHNHNNATEAIVVDNTNKETAVDAHKNQQHCVAHLPSQPQEQIAGDTDAPDANNNAEIAGKHEEYAYQPKWQQKRLAATEKGQLINREVCKVNIGVIGVENAAELDSVDRNSEMLSASEHLTVTGSDYMKGQAESKRHSKKHGGTTNAITGTGVGAIETKGTAMSFGFRKKLNTTPKKFKKLLEAGVGGMTGGDGKRKQDKCNNITATTRDDNTPSEDNEKRATVIDGAHYGETITSAQQQDDNGNAELLAKVHFEKMGAAAATTQRSNQATAAGGGAPFSDLPGVASRFGYRGGNIVRPASAGLTQHYHIEVQENAENNNTCGNNGNDAKSGGVGVNGQQKPLVSNLKRRSKSAHAGRALTSGDETSESGSCSDAAGRPKITQPKSITFNLSQNSTIEYQRRQFFEQPNTYGSYGSGRSSAANVWTHQPGHQAQQHQSRNVISTGMHTNVIVRPTPRAPPASFSKFTLHTVSLPKPEFPVAISVGATTPTTPSSIYTPSPTIATSVAGARTKENQQQHPLTVVACATVAHSASGHMDLKTAKQMANNTRRGFSGSREISADSGIASMDMALDSSVSSGGGSRAGRTASPKRSRSRPRNLQMVMNGRHKFEVRDLDDPLSSESSSIVEPLALPKLPNENQTAPLPLCGLVRSNTVLSRETYERNGGVIRNRSASDNQEIKQVDIEKRPTTAPAQCTITRNSSEESEGVDEEKLYLDRSTSEKGNRFKDINTCSSKTSSPGSSIMLSWCNAGESLAVKDCSSLSISSEDSNKLHGFNHQDKDTDTEKNDLQKFKHMSVDLIEDDLSGIVTEMQVSTLSSLTDNLANENNNSGLKTLETNTNNVASVENTNIDKPDRPKSFYNTLNETKFAEMALAGSTYLLDDETSPTDSLVSSTESEEAASKQKKHKINEELQEKDIDEISPELEMGSPISPGTPTHASHSLSLSDCGNLIDDEIADQPALLFNSEAHDLVDSLTSHKDKTDTPTLMENTGSIRSLKSQSKARSALQQAIELSLRTPRSLRKAVMERADSLDTLSPCESICSDDLMMDFDIHSSVDSIDRSGSIKSRSGSDLYKIDNTELFSELERKGSDVMKELNSLLRLRSNKGADKDVVIAHLPARATRLLNRSRLQQQQYPSSIASGVSTNAAAGTSVCGGGDSDSSKSAHSLRRSAAASRASNASTSSTNASLPPSTPYHHQKPFQHHYSQLHRDSHSSSDDLMLYDKSFRNAMIQDVLQFKKQLLRLRRLLQDTETLNPFDNDNGQLFAACGLDSKLLDEMDLASLTSSTTDDPMVELADLRRQGEVEDRERTIRLQKNQIEHLESKKPPIQNDHTKEVMNIATQTERTRPLSYGLDGLSRSKPEYTSYTTRYHPAATCEINSICNGANNSNNNNNNLCTYQQQHNCCNGSNNNLPAATTEAASQQIRRHTIISTTLSNYNQQSALAPRRASIAWEKPTAPAPTTPLLAQTAAVAGTKHAPPAATTYKPVKITLIGEPLKQWQWNAVGNGKTSDRNGHIAAGTHRDKEGNAKREPTDGNKSGSKSNRCGGSGGMCNGKSNSANCSNGSNGYTNGTSSQASGLNEVSSNGLQKERSHQPNHNHQRLNLHMQQALTQPGQQQQTRVQQQQQVYHTANGTNGNFNPTVTIV